MADIITITVNPALDLSTEAPAVIPDRKLRCATMAVHPGGGGVNVSRAIANLGGESRTLIALGGPTGDRVADLLAEEGLVTETLGVAHPTRESVSVRDRATGLQYRFMMPGPEWSEADCATAREVILGAVGPDTLVVPSGSLPPGMAETFFLDLAGDVMAAGGRMVLDTSGPALERAAGTRSGLHVLRMDLAEAEELSGRRLARIEQVAEMAASLLQAGAAEIVMIAADAQGTVLATRDWLGLARPPFVVVQSKIGGGDSFVGAFTYALARGEDARAACAWGTAAAASAVTQPGTDLCVAEDTDRYYRQVTLTEL